MAKIKKRDSNTNSARRFVPFVQFVCCRCLYEKAPPSNFAHSQTQTHKVCPT